MCKNPVTFYITHLFLKKKYSLNFYSEMFCTAKELLYRWLDTVTPYLGTFPN